MGIGKPYRDWPEFEGIFPQVNKSTIDIMTDLELLKNMYDKLGVEYHEVKSDKYTYITKCHAHDVRNKTIIVYLKEMEASVNNITRCRSYFEFENGKLVSW